MEKLLVVDDVELNRALLGEMFRTDFILSEAKNGREAVEILEQEHDKIAAVLLDIVMPEMDGFGVLRTMTERNWIGRIPVVMITAESSDSVMQRGYEMGAADIISKPFNPNIVRQRIHNVVEQYKYRHKLEVLVQEQTQELRRQSRELRENSVQLIDILSTIIEFKNTESVQHIYHIRGITRMLLTELASSHKEYGLTEEMIEASSDAAATHDIGKIAIPDGILNKPGKLTPEEFEIIKTHTVRGCEILEKIQTVQKLGYYSYCYEICRHHHERWDGRGYPDGLLGDETPIWAQAVSLADVYDALISRRVYKEAIDHQEALNMILDGKCGVFNPILVECLLKILPQVEAYVVENGDKKVSDKKDEVELRTDRWSNAADQNISGRTLRLLEMERQKYHILSELSEETLFDYDVAKNVLTFSEKYQILTGKDLEIKEYRKSLAESDAITDEQYQNIQRLVDKITPEEPSIRLQVQLDLDGLGKQWYDVYIYSVWNMEFEPKPVSYIGKLINIESQKQEERRLQLVADSDPLTDVWNRNAIKSRIEESIRIEGLARGVLCFVDLDNFKAANDLYGHAFGDEILRRVAGVLKAGVRMTDLVGRLGGDEFLLFLRNVSKDEAESCIRDILKSLKSKFGDYEVSASVGITCYPEDGKQYDELLRKADEVLYSAKQSGKNSCRFYDEIVTVRMH